MADDDGDEGESPQQHPLAGVVMCCTSIAPEQRTALASAATVMGAVHKLDLTADVTHLLVGSWDTPKYRYVARERPDVRCLRPSFVDAAHAAWIEGRDDELLNLPALEEAHRWPTFGGVRVCITGFQDPALRREIERIVVEGGGEYKGDLTREITHLIAHEPKGAKYVHAKHWGIKCVAIEWLQDTVERGMVLEERYYDPALEPQERGIGSWVRRRTDIPGPGDGNENARIGAKRKAGPVSADADKPTRKLRRTASARFSTQNENIWGDIVGGGFETSEPRRDAWDESAIESQSASRGSATTHGSGLQRSISAPSMRAAASSSKGFFEDKIFYLHGFDKKQTSVLQRHLTTLKACILSDEAALLESAKSYTSENRIHLLVPHSLIPTSLPAIERSAYLLVTEFWLEKCLHAKQFLEPGSKPIYEPLPGKIPGFEKLTVSSTGFVDIDLLHVGKTIRELGASYEGTLSRKVSVLLCNNEASKATDKLSYARSNGIPTVKVSWLWECMRTRKVASVEPHLLFQNDKEDTGASRRRESKANEKPLNLRKESPVAPGSRRASTDHGQQVPHLETAATTFDVQDSFAMADEADGGIRPTTANTSFQARPALGSRSLHRALQERSPNTSPTKISADAVSVERAVHIDSQAENITINKPTASARALESALADVLAARLRGRTERPSSAGSDSLAAEPYAVAGVAAPPAAAAGEGGEAGARRRKKLFGRAASNLSARSGKLSRTASIASVGSANTDGVGTPLGPGSAHVSPAKMRIFGANAALARATDGVGETEAVQEDVPGPATQVSYEDPEARAWQRQLAAKQGWEVTEAPEQSSDERRLKNAGWDAESSDEGRRRTRRVYGARNGRVK